MKNILEYYSNDVYFTDVPITSAHPYALLSSNVRSAEQVRQIAFVRRSCSRYIDPFTYRVCLYICVTFSLSFLVADKIKKELINDVYLNFEQ